ncbi:MAG: sulfite exporter TauE/SafE family protein [Phycisphaerales bacterium]
MEPKLVLITFAIGLVAGAVGGLAGIGGSIIILPALGLFLGYSSPTKDEHHEYMAAAMVVNVVVAFSSFVQHRRAGAVRRSLVFSVAPAMMAAIVVGVAISDYFNGSVAKMGLIAFLFAFCLYTFVTSVRHLPDHKEDDERGGIPLLVAIGGVTGLLAGFLGIGGGIVIVPLLAVLARVPLRLAIAASAAVMCVSAPLGATTKLITLHTHSVGGVPLAWQDALVLAMPMSLGAMLGAMIGARLTHRLKLTYLRLAISVILAIAGARMAGWI